VKVATPSSSSVATTQLSKGHAGPARTAPVRILHIVGGMDRGGVETWLMHVLRHVDRTRFAMDFLVHREEPCAYDEEIRGTGSRILVCPRPRRLWAYARNFTRILRDCGPYEVVHSHVHHFSGYTLRLAERAGVPVRIAQSHNDTAGVEAECGLLRRLYLRWMRRLIVRHSTVRIGVSRRAAAALFGDSWRDDAGCRLLYYGIDFAPFRQHVDVVAIRRDLGIPGDALVLGHVGRFFEQKNHAFLVDVFAEVAKQEPRARLLLVGEGPLRPDIERKIASRGLTEKVILTGARPDVPRLMLGAMDVFVFPSRWEGLGLVHVEAQAAGLPCVISDVLPEEADVVASLVRRVGVAESAATWAAAVLKNRSGRTAPRHAIAMLESGRFDIRKAVKELETVYLQGSHCVPERSR
jgi:glycosyltransferase involved in cell wall biosynthesis